MGNDEAASIGRAHIDNVDGRVAVSSEESMAPCFPSLQRVCIGKSRLDRTETASLIIMDCGWNVTAAAIPGCYRETGCTRE
jgi:hypothetical protein